MKLTTVFIVISLLSQFSCKKESAQQNQQATCLVDSISVHNYWTYFLKDASGYKFKYENNILKQINVYNPIRLVEIQKLFFDTKGRLAQKDFYLPDSLLPYFKSTFIFDINNHFTGIRAYVPKLGSNSSFFKFYELLITYNNNSPASAISNFWQQSDTINPSSTNLVNYSSKNGNIEKTVWDNSGKDSISFTVISSENPLYKNFQFLIDPVFEFHNFYFERIHLLPVLLNKNTTITVSNSINFPFYNIRISSNQYGQPESISSSMATWDYYYKNCQ